MANLDHISKAVQRARRERNAAAKNNFSSALDQAASAYNQIRTIKLSQEFLRAQRVFVDEKEDDEEYVRTYKQLRTHVLQQLRQKEWDSFGITSSIPGEGKTLTAINLSIQLAMEGKRVVILVDADLRRPSIHKYFGYTPAVGFGDYFLSGALIETILVRSEIGRLAILPGRDPIRNPSENLSSSRMGALIKELKIRYGSPLVIFDLPPLLLGDDVMAFSPYVDALLLVIEDGKVSRDELARSGELLKDFNVLGTVLNKTVDPVVGYSSYYYDYDAPDKK